MPALKVGVQLQPQATTVAELRDAWRRADDMGADSIWLWDHFFPIFGDPAATQFEGWTLLAAMAVDTTSARLGTLVTSNSYRNPDLLADMARTVDHLSGGRAYLGIGAGWFERDYAEYGYDFGTAASRIRDLEHGLERIKARFAALTPPATGPLTILIGGSGEQITLRLVAQHADAWNSFGPVENFRHKSGVLDRWCAEVGRDPATIERTVAVSAADPIDLDAYVEAGAQHVILMTPAPYDLGPLAEAIALRDASA